MRLILFVGFQSSGKSTAAEALFPYGFCPLSFADALKDMLASIFCWERHLLEGITPESRHWREQVDAWWAERLAIPQFTPRWAMQNIGTEVMRRKFNEDIWILNVERRLHMIGDTTPIILIDGRYPNEIALAKRYNGHVERIKRGQDPSWYALADCVFNDPKPAMREYCRDVLRRQAHESEWAWLGSEVDGVTENNGTVADLHTKIITKFVGEQL